MRPSHHGTAGTEGSLPSSLDPSTRTLILVNQERLGDLYGAAASEVMSTLDELATTRTPPATKSTSEARWWPSRATAAWPRPMSLGRRAVLDRGRQRGRDPDRPDRRRSPRGLRDLRRIVPRRSDEALPFGQVPDRTASFSEANAGLDFRVRGLHNPATATLVQSYVLSDNPYGDVAPSTSGQPGVPAAAGRRPARRDPSGDRGRRRRLHTSPGVRSPNASFNAAYDWMLTAGQGVDRALGPDVATRATKLDSDRLAQANRWTKTDAAAGLEVAAHGFFSINAHSDPTQTLSSADWGSKTATPDLLTTEDLPDDLANGIGLTLGCHMGLNLADTFVGNPNPAEQAALYDWSQAILHNKGVLRLPPGTASARRPRWPTRPGSSPTSRRRASTERRRCARASCGRSRSTCASACRASTTSRRSTRRPSTGCRCTASVDGPSHGSFLPEEGTPTGPAPANATTSVTYRRPVGTRGGHDPGRQYSTVADARRRSPRTSPSSR